MESGERFGGRHRHHGGGRRRVFDHGDLRFILLSMIAARPAHGYDLIKALAPFLIGVGDGESFRCGVVAGEQALHG
jgi:hypothetical protein